VSRYN